MRRLGTSSCSAVIRASPGRTDDPQTGVGHFYGSQSSTGPALYNLYGQNGTKVDPSTGRPIYWGNNEPFYGALEPISKNGLVDSNTSTNQQKPTNLPGNSRRNRFDFWMVLNSLKESGENNYLGNVSCRFERVCRKIDH